MAADSQTIARLRADDYPHARGLLGRAFHDYNLMAYCLPDERRRLANVTTVYAALMADCFRVGEVYTTGNRHGVACWIPPGVSVAGTWRQIRAGMLRVPLRVGLRGLRRLIAYDNASVRLHHRHAPMPHWHLSLLAVEPAAQGQGIGSAVMQPMLRQADAQGLPCYLDTHQGENVRLYQRHGFEVAERQELPGHPVPVFAMVRRPRRGV